MSDIERGTREADLSGETGAVACDELDSFKALAFLSLTGRGAMDPLVVLMTIQGVGHGWPRQQLEGEE